MARSELVAELVVAALVGEIKDEMCGRWAMCVSSRGGLSAPRRLVCTASDRDGIFNCVTGNEGDGDCVGANPGLDVRAAGAGAGCVLAVFGKRCGFNGEG